MVVSSNNDRTGSHPRAAAWACGAALLGLVLALAVLAFMGDGRAGTTAAMRVTARLAFLLFWPSYAGGALVALLGNAFQPVKVRAKSLGLAFGAVLAVHLGLVGWLCWIGDAPPVETFAIFGLAAAWTLLLAISSIERVGLALGDVGRWALRNIGMNYIAFAFAFDFLTPHRPVTALKVAEYLPFAALSVFGPLLRLLASLKQRLGAVGSRAEASPNGA